MSKPSYADGSGPDAAAPASLRQAALAAWRLSAPEAKAAAALALRDEADTAVGLPALLSPSLTPARTESRAVIDPTEAIASRLAAAGDAAGAAILDIILRDEIGHVAIGNHWYRHLCAARGLDPVSTYAELAARYRAPRLRGPFNLEARRAAGFDEDELAALQRAALQPGAQGGRAR